ncbi:MAG: hypothetical protein ACRDD7_06860 [Peptostreptococcaceae bacterium]
MDRETLQNANYIDGRLRTLKREKADLDKGAKLSMKISTKEAEYPCQIDDKFKARISKAYADEIESLEKEFKEL